MQKIAFYGDRKSAGGASRGLHRSAACKFTVGELVAGVLGGVILFAVFLAICNRLKDDA
jgi:hypothetical protein